MSDFPCNDPLSSKGHGTLSIHYAADQETIETRSGHPDVLMGQSIVLSAIKTEVPLDSDDPANQNFLLQQYL